MLFLVGSGNRDDRQFPDGDHFDIHRQISQQLTFGYGIHFCLGAALARLEGRIALEEVLSALPRVDRRPRRGEVVADFDRPRVGDPARRPPLTDLFDTEEGGEVRVLGADLNEPSPPRRGYDNRRRIEQAAQTRERIITAAIELVRRSAIRDWRGVTVRAVADKAGVSERTVYRHFGAERGMRDAVMRRLEEQAGIDLASLRLEDVAEITERTLKSAAAYPRPPKPELDPTLVDANQRQHEALVRAVTAAAADWPEPDRVLAAAVLDVLWSVASYERLATDWQLASADAVRGLAWVVNLVEEAITSGDRPSE